MPPLIDLNSKALLKILINILGILFILISIIIKHTNKYKNLICIAVEKGYLKGDNGNINPKSFLTRAEACALFNRMNKEIDKRFDILNKVLEEKYGDV